MQNFDTWHAHAAAHRHLIAIALAIASQDKPDRAAVLEAMTRKLVTNWANSAAQHLENPGLRNEIVNQYVEEVAQVKQMALSFMQVME